MIDIVGIKNNLWKISELIRIGRSNGGTRLDRRNAVTRHAVADLHGLIAGPSASRRCRLPADGFSVHLLTAVVTIAQAYAGDRLRKTCRRPAGAFIAGARGERFVFC